MFPAQHWIFFMAGLFLVQQLQQVELTLMKRLLGFCTVYRSSSPLSFPTHLSLPFSTPHLLLFILLSFSFPFPKPFSLSAINKNGLPAWLSVPVKCNPKSTASSSTTILMVMGSILYQGYHILLEMTVSKVRVDAVGTKTGAAFCQSGGAGRVCLRVCERLVSRMCVCVGGWWLRWERALSLSYCPLLFGAMMRWDGIVLPFLLLLFWKRESRAERWNARS